MSDDFPEAVKRVLASRVGNLCSNPGCRALTSGPQEDPTKAVNLGVAAHITAASPGGPRYDSRLSSEERTGHENGIWLCQNCAKHVDNDVVRFSVEVLKKWKVDSEAEANARVGKTAVSSVEPAFDIKKYARVRISPIVPRQHEQSDWMVMQDAVECFLFRKLDSQAEVEIPRSFIEKVHSFGHSKPALVQLSGRLQWVSAKRHWELFSDKPPAGPSGAYGIGKDVDFGYPTRQGIIGKFGREDRLPEILGRAWYVFYDLDGTYLRWGDQVLVIDWV